MCHQDGRTAKIKVEIPNELFFRGQTLVEHGLYRSIDDLISDALCQFLNARLADIAEQQVRADIEWGLSGTV